MAPEKKKKLIFQNVARFVKEARMSSQRGWSQSEVAAFLGMKNGQFISNVERGLCSIPEKYIFAFCRFTNVSHDAMIEAILADYREALYREISKGLLDEIRSL